ncbi:MAG: DUF1844 domain-containing protein [bacterium]
MSEKDDIIEGPGFTIIDRRIGAKKTKERSGDKADETETSKDAKSSLKEGTEKEKPREREKPGEKVSEEIPLPEVDFPSFIMSLSTSVFIHLGEIPDPTTNQKNINLPLAKQTIDLIAMLKEKTEGNRTEDEDRLMDELLYNLRMKFLALSRENP